MGSWLRLLKNLSPPQRAVVVGMLLLIVATWLAVCVVLVSLGGP